MVSASDGSRQLASKWPTTPLHWAVPTEPVGRRTRCSHPVSRCSTVVSIEVSEDTPWHQQLPRPQRSTKHVGVSGLRCAVAPRPGPRQSGDRRHTVLRWRRAAARGGWRRDVVDIWASSRRSGNQLVTMSRCTTPSFSALDRANDNSNSKLQWMKTLTDQFWQFDPQLKY